jgi:DNA-binding response OmpR family regulator
MSEKQDTPPTILLVEQDDDTRPILRHNLRNRGYHVLVALDEEEALALARGGRAHPSVILLNQVRLPIDEFINMGRRILKGAGLPKSTPIVVTAERYGADMEGRDVLVGESEYVTYLEDGQQLMNLLQRLCRER